MEAYTYSAYGLNICSALSMPELLSADFCVDAADVVVSYGELERPEPDEMKTFYYARASEGCIFYYLRDIGGVSVRDGREIIVDPLPGSEEKGFRFLVSGIAMGLLLHQRGVLTLHASAVNVHGRAAAFIGWKGMGKSTTASALHARGHAIITDDLLVLEVMNDQVMVVPGFPSVKLLPEAVAAAFDENPDDLPRVHPESTKRYRDVGEGFSLAAIPLEAIYVLDFGTNDEPTLIETLTPREAYIELVRHSFAIRVLNEKGVTTSHVQQCSELLRHVPVRRLKRRRSLSGLRELASLIEQDLGCHKESVDENSLAYA